MKSMSPYLAEFIGTLFFLFVIIFTGEALPIGLALIIVILILGKFSNGGHQAVRARARLALRAAGRVDCHESRHETQSPAPSNKRQVLL
mgnify:CR=1 FL=1